MSGAHVPATAPPARPALPTGLICRIPRPDSASLRWTHPIPLSPEAPDESDWRWDWDTAGGLTRPRPPRLALIPLNLRNGRRTHPPPDSDSVARYASTGCGRF